MQRTSAASVEYLGWLWDAGHIRLVQGRRLSDKAYMVAIADILRPALDWVLPERCPCCGVIKHDGGPFCVDCWQKLHFLNPPWCAGCASPFAIDRGDDALCAACLADPPLHNGVRAAVRYDDLSAQVALKFKYGGKIGLAKMIARQLVRHLPERREGIIVTPVPLHWTRIWSRSFNQSALIAQEVARLGGLEYVPDLLVRRRQTPSMRGLNAAQRRKAVGKAFAVNAGNSARLHGARLILVDDVLTTGATSDGCVRALKKGGADWVQIFCWARALRGEGADVLDAVPFDAVLLDA